MVKAVFFDWFNTLARYDPPREDMYYKAFKESGIEIPVKVLFQSLTIADQQYFAENSKRPVRERSPEEQAKIFSIYPLTMLAKANVKAQADLPATIIKRLMKDYGKMNMVLFDDVLPVLKDLKKRGPVIGMITNADASVSAYCEKLGLSKFLNFVATSQEAGAEKPAPPIFLLALRRAGVKAEEAIHVGDQYQIDIVGARGVGIKPILLDRYDINPEINDCPRIASLNELAQFIG